MNRLKELAKTNNIVKLSLIILPIVVILLSTTLAYYSWGSGASNNTNIAFDVIADSVYVYYDAGADITGADLYPTDDKNDGIVKEITVRVDKQIPGASFNLYLDLKTLPDALKEESFKYALYGVNTDGSTFNIGTNGLSTTATTTVSGNFSTTGVSCTTNNTTHYVLLNNVNPTVAEMKYVLYIWIDGVNYTNPDTMMNQSFEFTLHADGINLREPLTAATTTLINLYENATTTPVTTTGGEAITQSTDLGLMQDSFGNIRYYGADPDNYVTFNGEEAGWRIIGVFDVEDENGNTEKRIKLIRATSIGTFAYDNKPSGVGTSTSDYGSNDWTDARLMMLLNPEYETASDLYAYEGSLYWNRKSGTCYAGESEGTKSCDFTSTGLTDEAKSMIGQAKYYLGGSSSYSGLYADDYYTFERGTTVYSGHQTEWTGYVGIMYPSDYAYAADLSVCAKDGYNYDGDTTNCKGTDWLLDTSTTTWNISPLSSNAFAAFNVISYGRVYFSIYVYYAYGVRPVIYLNSDVAIVSGEGTSDKPYVLG